MWLPKLTLPFTNKRDQANASHAGAPVDARTSARQRQEKARETARANVPTMLAEGYRFAPSVGTKHVLPFFADRLCDLATDEIMSGYFNCYKPDQLHAVTPKPAYLMAGIRSLTTGEIRFVCSCPFWKTEWYASANHAFDRFGWCKHTLCMELLLACALPLHALIISLLPASYGPDTMDAYRSESTPREPLAYWAFSPGNRRAHP